MTHKNKNNIADKQSNQHTIDKNNSKKYIVLEKPKWLEGIIEEINNASKGCIKISWHNETIPFKNMITSDRLKYYGILVSEPNSESAEKNALLDQMLKEGMIVDYLPNIAEKYLKRIPEKVLAVFQTYYEVVFSNIKPPKLIRFLDIIFSFILLLLSMPFLLIAAIYIVLKDGGPVFFKQERMGFRGQTLMVYKLRTYKDIVNQNGEPDVTTTASGPFLRKFRLNELPQLINVIRGDMSLVGPRPEVLEEFNDHYQFIPFYFKRLYSLPGITGHAQVCYKYCDSLDEFRMRFEYDLYFIKNQSAALYIMILFRTLTTVFLGKGM